MRISTSDVLLIDFRYLVWVHYNIYVVLDISVLTTIDKIFHYISEDIYDIMKNEKQMLRVESLYFKDGVKETFLSETKQGNQNHICISENVIYFRPVVHD